MLRYSSKEYTSAAATDYGTQYRALSITKQLPTQGFELLVDPEDLLASPLGWHNDGVTTLNATIGNNVVSTKVIDGQVFVTAESASGLIFDYPANFSQKPTVAENVAAARVNAFYVVNTVHDIAYRYGFTEQAFK